MFAIANNHLIRIGYLLLIPMLIWMSACHAPRQLVYQNIEHFSLKNVGLSKSTLTMDIRLYNPNKYGICIKDADVDVFMNGKNLGKLDVNKQCYLGRKDTVSLPVKLDVDMKNVLSDVMQLFLNTEVNIKVVGKIKAGRHGLFVNIPVSYEGKQDILSGLK